MAWKLTNFFKRKYRVFYSEEKTDLGKIKKIYLWVDKDKIRYIGFINPSGNAFIKEVFDKDKHILHKFNSVGVEKEVLEFIKEKFPSVRYVIFRIKGYRDILVEIDELLNNPDKVVTFNGLVQHHKIIE